jgi:hypothetical protein
MGAILLCEVRGEKGLSGRCAAGDVEVLRLRALRSAQNDGNFNLCSK